ncbi:MAG TPA: di-heme oxidoredictase family protein, partial [Geminicoccaceae bacterium]|nr:di-heme oxidoredictase family protein [Geminicoccaceae bacterium]
PAGPGDSAVSMFLRLSVPAESAQDRELLATRRANVIPEPTYGAQLQDLAVPGHAPEGRMVIDYEEVPVELADREVVHLRRPGYRIADLGYGPLHDEVMHSARVAPPMIGLGLLEAVAEEDILALADPDDANGDGISGRPNLVWSDEHEEVVLGRFGWKAGEPTLNQQGSHAMAGDVGISNPLSPAAWGDCTAAQSACRAAPNGNSVQHDGLEASGEVMDQILFYARNLAVPARRGTDDPLVLQGKRLFYEAGCTGCHVPKLATRRDWEVGALAGQLIWSYSDLLLHDMGEGLADGRPEGVASGREWRTTPLWGIGLTETVNGHTYFLHDGRARNLTEAILWHGGEAEAARDMFAGMLEADRKAMLAFLNSL